MNKKIWLGAYLASFVIFLASALIVGFIFLLQIDYVVRLDEKPLTIVIVIGVLAYLQFVLVSIIYNFALLYKMWSSIQDGVNPITVGKAIGFLFIPVFSVYWIFRAWGSFPTEYNNFVDRHKLAAPRVTSSIFIFFPIGVLIASLLVLPLLVVPVVFAVLIARTCDAVQNLSVAKRAMSQGILPGPDEFIGGPGRKRSKAPLIISVATGVLIFVISIVALLVVNRNLHPTLASDELPESVGSFKLRRPAYPSGSIFGLRSSVFADYESEERGKKKPLQYRMYSFARASDAIEHKDNWSSYCRNESSKKAGVLQDSSGDQIGDVEVCSRALVLRNRKRVILVTRISDYEAKEGSRLPASIDEMIAFAKTVPFNAGMQISNLSFVPMSPTSSQPVATNEKTGVVSLEVRADFSMTAEEYYEQTNGKSSSEVAKFKGKIIELSGRYYRLGEFDGRSTHMHAGKNFIYGDIDASKSADFEKLKEDDRVRIKCLVPDGYTARFKYCILVENKGAISPDDKPDFTFSADEYFNEVSNINVSIERRMKNQEKYRGKIILVSGALKIIGGEPYYLTAGERDFVTCKPDGETTGSFLGLMEGQEVKLMGIGGISSGLNHCLVISKP